MISPLDYSCDFLLYVAASMEMIGMVLIQEDEELHEHVIYYLSRNLIDAEISYSHVEKFDSATVHAVQRLRHYILLRQTLVVAHVNLFQFVLTRRMIGGKYNTRRMIGGKYNKWIVILQEFNLESLVQVINFAMEKRGNIHGKVWILPRLSVFFPVETISSQ